MENKEAKYINPTLLPFFSSKKLELSKMDMTGSMIDLSDSVMRDIVWLLDETIPPIKKLYFAIREDLSSAVPILLKGIKDINEIPESEDMPVIELALRRTSFDCVPFIYTCPGLNFDELHKIRSVAVLCETVRLCRDLEVVKRVASDTRIACCRLAKGSYNPLELAIVYGYYEMARWILYLRHNDIDEVSTSCFEHENQGHYFAGKEVFDLFHELKRDPVNAKFRLGLELAVPKVLAALLYATVIFHCDGLLRIREECPAAGWFFQSRFFSVVSRLPMDLQMAMCNRFYGVSADIIPAALSEPAFRHLARVFSVMETES